MARLAQGAVSNVQLVHVSLEKQKETEHAKEAAETLKLPIHTSIFDAGDVKKDLPAVLRIIEEADPVKTAIGIPIYWAAEQASRMGLTIMLAGQGADELFGGYRRYVDDYLVLGEEAVSKSMFRDVERLCENNLERDSKICGFHNVDLRLPFATLEVAEFALSLPISLKIDPEKIDGRKLVLRKTAENMGLPESISRRPKKAVQYATGVDRALKRLAKPQRSVAVFLQNEFRDALAEAA
jgi:asparagine synthase (glutamine-hydrolysing)